jgi:hypothetical protein
MAALQQNGGRCATRVKGKINYRHYVRNKSKSNTYTWSVRKGYS